MATLTVIEHSDALTQIALSGRLDVQGVERVELQFTSHTAARKRPAIVDLAELDFIASLGIGMLISAAKALRTHGASIVLLSPRETVERILRLSSTHRVIPIASTREQALELLGVSSSS